MRTRDYIRKMIKLIDEHGLAVRKFEDANGSLCLLGAARKSITGTTTFMPNKGPTADAYTRVKERLAQSLPPVAPPHLRHAANYDDIFDKITLFNDHHTQDEVLAKLRSMAR